MTTTRRSLTWLLFAVGLAACSSESGNDTQGGQFVCTDGQTSVCGCTAGQTGTATCAGGQWLPCSCAPGPGTGGSPIVGAGGAVGGSGGGVVGVGGFAFGTGGGTAGIPGAGGVIGVGGTGDGGAPSTGGVADAGLDSGPADGGQRGSGGSPGTGGAQSTGGAVATGGAQSTGGSQATGGTVSTGGAQSTGGAPSTGGAQSTGGSQNTGGNTSTGGAPSTGGNTSTGGAQSTGGAPSTGGTSGTGGSGTGGTGNSGGPTKLPTPTATCPTLTEGVVTVLGRQVTLRVGTDGETKLGPVVIYWHATGSSPSEINTGLGSAAINEIKSMGGMVVAMNAYDGASSGGTTTGNNVWYTGDFTVTDEVIACAIQTHVGIDTSRIHTTGFSAGGLQASYMIKARSNYIASATAYSGGAAFPVNYQDSTNHAATIFFYGGDSDTFGTFNFKTASLNMASAFKTAGHFVVTCDHGGGHSIPPAGGATSWTFFKDHPYKVSPEPYAGGLPSFPTYCTIY